MTGRPPLDPRRHAYRDDLAAESLRGQVTARRYAPGVRAQVIRSAVGLRPQPQPGSGLDTEALFGETLARLDEAGGWAWVQLERDGYVGYVPADALSTDVRTPTHAVSALGTFIYPVPDIKAAPLLHVSLTSPLAVAETMERMSRLEGGGFVVNRHIAPLPRRARDFVDIAERFVGTPYLWGGRTRLGLDCSGLVQLAMEAAGLDCPRDSDMQRTEVGASLGVPADLAGLQRGDLVCWQGHVGIMTDGVMLLHSNAHHMAVVSEPLAEAAGRIRKAGLDILDVRRPAALGAGLRR